MNKSVDRLKKHLLELAEAVNSFNSEAVQVKVISCVIKDFAELKNTEAEPKDGNENIEIPKPQTDVVKTKIDKKPGLTKLIQKELLTGYFQTPRTLPSITEYLAEKYESTFYTYQTSGIVLKLIKAKKLIRERDEAVGKFVYSQIS
jgi:hypothetical protein